MLLWSVGRHYVGTCNEVNAVGSGEKKERDKRLHTLFMQNRLLWHASIRQREDIRFYLYSFFCLSYTADTIAKLTKLLDKHMQSC
jgi:hypothetical protein